MEVYSDSHNYFLDCNEHRFSREEQAYVFEDDLKIPCKNFAAVKLSIGNKHHTVDFNCAIEGQRKLSFKVSDYDV